jgi:hypothetical protein
MKTPSACELDHMAADAGRLNLPDEPKIFETISQRTDGTGPSGGYPGANRRFSVQTLIKTLDGTMPAMHRSTLRGEGCRMTINKPVFQ